MSSTPKVLHVVENLHRGAVENWLARMLRYGKRRNDEVNWTFYCALNQPGQLDDEMRKLGAGVVLSPYPLGKTRYFISALRDHLKAGKYDVLHCHHDLVSALYLTSARDLPIPTRIVHVHNADEVIPTSSPAKKKALKGLFRWICLRSAKRIVGISNHTLDTFLHGRKRKAGRDRVHYYGVDPAPFASGQLTPEGFRKNLGLPEDSLLLLFAGRMVPEKNPVFAVDVLNEMRKINPRVFGIFAGAGALESSVKARAQGLGLTDFSRFLGWRQDAGTVMRCCDWFIHPHVEEALEGLGLALVEAQLAGLPLVLSKGVADDPLLPGSAWVKLGLGEGPTAWAPAALKLLDQKRNTPEEAVEALRRSPFDMEYAWKDLCSLHQ